MHTARIQRDNVLWREALEGEAYIGDAGSTPTLDMQVDSLRIAATNINKNTYGKLSAELATWFRANALDFLIIADSDLPAHKATQLWTPAHGGTHAPSLMAEIGDYDARCAIRNLYDILYNIAKLKWGETSQTKKALNRAEAIQRTNRCTAQLRQLLRLHEAAPRTGMEYTRLAHLVEWPKWIRDPTLLPPTCWHRADAIAIGEWWTTMPTTQHPTPDWDHWLRQGLARWTKVCRKRRDWRTTSLRLTWMQQRTAWFNRSHTRKFLRSALGNTTPPISIQSVIVRPTDGPPRYSSNRDEVAAGLRHLLDNWIPPVEKTTRPRHLDSGLETDRENVSISSATGYSRTWTDLTKLHKPSNPLRALPGTPTTTMKTCKPAATAASAHAYPQDMGASPRNSGSLPLHTYEPGNG
ncbi:hypothetical protein B5M09_013903 [Aphanomyces astaci]|uniref:Uncharacterized protein n=1 Tax=Aphanomyces astaci TaxID=112090 RepID=A0A425CQT0_APHAT|nr:hypothetical protein B5M09_013903 [Aphanomyces astaci]